MKIKRKHNHIFTYILIIIILCFIFSILFINYFNKIALPYFKKYAYRESNRIVSNIINESITNNLPNINTNNLIIIKDNDIDFDTNYVNKYLQVINNDIINKLNTFDNNIYYIPLFSILDNSMLANIGPQIPIKMSIMGNVINNISVEVNEYGINNMLIKLSLNTKISIGINLPFNNEEVEINNNTPISYKIVSGNIPNVYAGGYKFNSNDLSNNILNN